MNNRKDISAIILVKNGENELADCIDSLRFCNEIIVVDNDSEDRSREIAERLGCKVYRNDSENFSELRNMGRDKAVCSWIFYIDVDERVSPELAQEIKEKIPKTNFSAFRIKRKNFYLGNFEWPYIESLERLFKKDKLKRWKGKLHESPVVSGEIGKLNNFILHYTHKDLSSMLDKTIKWSSVEAENRFLARHPKMTWWRFPRVMITAFFDSYIRQEGFKAGTAGLIESLYQSYSMFITYARLWEIQEEKGKF